MIQWTDSNDPESNAKPAASRPLILVIDDEPQVLHVFSRALNLAGYDTQVAPSAEAALAMLRVRRPDAVLVDLRMPFINGTGLLYRLRQSYPQMPVAVITGMYELDGETKGEIGAMGAEIHFKPLSIAEVQQAAGCLLGNRHAGRAEHAA